MNKTNKRITGFTETLQPITKKIPNINTNVCLPIYLNGMNSNKINFFQSEFPNLIKIKLLIQNSVKSKTNNKTKKFSNASKKNKVFTTNSKSKKKVRFASY